MSAPAPVTKVSSPEELATLSAPEPVVMEVSAVAPVVSWIAPVAAEPSTVTTSVSTAAVRVRALSPVMTSLVAPTPVV